MKSIIFISQADAEKYQPSAEEVLISVITPIFTPPVFQTGWKDILQLCFNDVTSNDLFKDAVLFSEEDANNVVAFANKHADCEILVHCLAGISRSSAIALAIAKAQGRQCPPYDYDRFSNARVLRMTEEAFKKNSN